MTTLPRSSRYVRPPLLKHGLDLQPRDRALLRSVFTHRFMRSDHLRALFFAGASLRVAQLRLRRLWEHHLLERHYLPFVLDGIHPAPPRARQPIYALGPRGAEVVA